MQAVSLENSAQDSVYGRLKHAGIKLTRARKALLELLIKEHGPFTPEQLFQKVKDQGCDLATVYRCITVFIEVGLVRKCVFGDGVDRVEYLPITGEHHHHFICKECKRVEALEDCLIEAYEKKLTQKGYSALSHQLEFFGLCEACS